MNTSLLRSGIALMVTVGIMALIAVVILGNLNLLDDAFTRSHQSQKFTQNQAVLKSFQTLLEKQSNKLTSESSLETFLVSLPGISDDEGLIVLDISISSLQGKLNINAIFSEDNKTLSNPHETMFLRIFDAYEIKEPHQLLAMIADTIDSDTHERYVNSELGNRYADMSQGAVSDKQHLKKISDKYHLYTEDDNVYKIPWDRFFRFGTKNSVETVDCNHLDLELAGYMGLHVKADINGALMSCDDIGLDDKQIKIDFKLEAFSKDKPYFVLLESEYKAKNIEGKLSLIYEIHTKEISHIKSY